MGLTIALSLIAIMVFITILTVIDIIKTANKHKLDEELQAKQRESITSGGSSIHYPSSVVAHLSGGGPALQRAVPVNPSSAYLGESHPSRSYIDESQTTSIDSDDDELIDDIVITGLDILAGSYTPDQTSQDDQDQVSQPVYDTPTYQEPDQSYEAPSYSEPEQDSSYSSPDESSFDSSSSNDD